MHLLIQKNKTERINQLFSIYIQSLPDSKGLFQIKYVFWKT